MIKTDLEIIESAASTCTNCSLSTNRWYPVFAKGNPHSKLLICGMVPGPEENKMGLPFVGRAGILLDKILFRLMGNSAMGEVYITNIVKCALAPGIPLKQEWIDECVIYFIAQMSAVRPDVIITLGADATNALLGLPLNTRIGLTRGKVHTFYNTDLIPTYHPSYLVRGGGEKHIHYNTVLEDFELALLHIEE